MDHSILRRTVLLALAFGSISLLPAQYGRWDYLGQSNVDGRRDHDMIRVGRHRGRYRAIHIRVERGPIEFDRVVVHYENGQSSPIPIRSRIGPGGQTRAIDLPGGARFIRGVEFYYARLAPGPRPKVRLFGAR